MLTDETLENLVSAQGRMEGKLDLLLDAMKSHVDEDDERFEKQDTRIQSTERKINIAIGSVSTLTFIASMLYTFGSIISSLFASKG